MKAQTPAAASVAASHCAVCGAELDALHTETDRTGIHCSFCGSRQQPEVRGRDLQLVTPSWTLDVGETLRGARQARGETLEQASHFTRIRLPYLRDLEAGDISAFDGYPGRVYARFFLKEYADHLGVDPGPLLQRLDRDDAPALQPIKPARITRRTPQPRRWAVGAAVLLIALLVAGAIVTRGDERTPIAAPTSTSRIAPGAAAPETKAPSPSPKPTFDGIQAVIVTGAPCWIYAIADDTTVLEETIPAGKTIKLDADQTLDLRFGNAVGLTLRVNGRAVPLEGGAVQDLSLTRQGGRVVVS